MPLFKILRKVRTRLEKLQSDLLGEVLVEGRKLHLDGWKTVCMDKKFGGLGIRKFDILNNALLSKWLWKHENKRDSLWSNIGQVWQVGARVVHISGKRGLRSG